MQGQSADGVHGGRSPFPLRFSMALHPQDTLGAGGSKWVVRGDAMVELCVEIFEGCVLLGEGWGMLGVG